MGELAQEGKSVFLFGAKPGVADTAGAKLQERFPGLVIAGTNDGYFQDDAPIIEKINAALCRQVRVQAGRDPEPSLAIIDSQSVKSTRTAGERGYDAGKKNQRVETPHPRGCDGPVAGDCRTPGQHPGS